MAPASKGPTRRRGPATRPSRDQLRAAEVRARQTREHVPTEVAGPTEPLPVAPRRPSRVGGSRPTSRVVPLSRDEEYRYIRSDLRRLVITAGSLLAVMLGLLVIVE